MKNVNWTHVAIAAGIAFVAGVIITNTGIMAKLPAGIGTLGMNDQTKALLGVK